MKPMNEPELRDLLTPQDTPAPPAGLARRIKDEIPLEIELDPAALDLDSRSAAPWYRTRWLAAAALLVTAGASFFSYRLLREAPPQAAPRVRLQVGREEPAPSEEPPASDVFPDAIVTAEAPTVPSTGDRSTTAGLARRVPLPEERPTAATGEAAATERSLLAAETQRRSQQLTQQLEARRPESNPRAAEALRQRDERGLGNERRSRRVEIPKPREAEELALAEGASAAVRQEPTRQLAESRFRLKKIGPAAAAADPSFTASLDAEAVRSVAPPSTGGTAEPNDAPYGDAFFRGYGTNPFVDTEDDALSTFGLDVDTGSYSVVRRYLSDGHLPPPDAVRVEELINYFDYGDAPPQEGDFALHAEGAPSIYGEGEHYYLLRFNLRGRDVSREDRPAALLTFVVDVSGSMARENRLGLVKRALGLLLDQLRGDDRVALVVYGSRGRVLLEPTGERERIRRAIEQLQPEGSTNAEEGLRLAYELAARHRRRGVINRVILCSDGVANVGNTGAESILERIRRDADKGIELTTVGFGMGNYNDVLMERLADTGNGRYHYVDRLDEARRVFVENLGATLQTLAAEARAQVEFDPGTVARYRLLGYENRDIADERFRDDTVDAGEVGAGHTVTALYELKLRRKPRRGDRIATLRLRYGSIAQGEMVELERSVTGADFAPRWESAPPSLRLTALVAEFAEVLKQTYWAKEGNLDDVFRRAQRLSADFPGDRDVADFVSLVGRAAAYRER